MASLVSRQQVNLAIDDRRLRESRWARSEASAPQLRGYLRRLRNEWWTLMAGNAGSWEQLRQGEDRDERSDLDTLRQLVSEVYRALGEAYTDASCKPRHAAWCRVHGAPQLRPGPCDCGDH